MKCVIVTIAKEEKLYIQEFIAYYLRMGCSNIFIYDNSDDNELKFLQNESVKVIHLPGGQKQLTAYNHFLKTYKNQYDYVGFFDVDEFLVLKKHKTITDFCKDYIPGGALGVNWYMFGNNGNTKYENKPVIERFTKRERRMNKHVKTIGKCSDILEMSVHNPNKMRPGCTFKNTFGERINGSFNEHTDDSVVQLNHYFSKSDEELKQKCERGRADIKEKRKYEEYLFYLNFNEVEDKSALTTV